MDDILNILDNKIHVTVTMVGFYSNGFDDADNELLDSKNKKDILKWGFFYSISRKLQNYERLIAELILPNNAIVGKNNSREKHQNHRKASWKKWRW